MYRKEKKIPTIIALFLLLGGIGAATLLDRSSQSNVSKASVVSVPQDIHFTNITDSSFSVSWFTNQPVVGSVVVTDNLQKTTLLDDADSDNVPRPRTTHYVTVKNLTETTSYSVKIISGGSCSDEKLCPLFTQNTATKLSTPFNMPPARGTILNVGNKPAEGTIVYIAIDKSSILSGRADSLGLWVIPFNNLRTSDLLSRPKISDSDIVQITAKLSPSETSTAIVDIKSIRQDLTVPNMTIGNSYNFIDLISKKDLLALSNDQKILGIQTQPTTSKKQTQPVIDILFPKSDSDTTSDKRPKLRGTGISGSQLFITVNSTPILGKVTVGKDGTWSWKIPKDLSPGIHHISIQGYDSLGRLTTVTRQFYVLKSGESVLGESTPSASLTPTSPPAVGTPGPTLPSTSSTPIPTVTTVVPTNVIPTSIPPTVIVTNPPPRSGVTTPVTILFGTSISMILLGVKFILFP